MISHRTRPLLAALGLGALVVTARLYEVQLVEHPVWADEAARLVHSGREIPYRRGPILDTKGRVLARDKDTHQLVLFYREFRRGHPLGIVAHARSLLEFRAVPLPEAHATRLAWARDLVDLTPAQLETFALGGELSMPHFRAGISVDPRLDRRAQRAKDLGFYLRRLLPLDVRQRRRLERRVTDGERDRSYLSLAAQTLGLEEERLWGHVAGEIEETLAALERLAQFLPWPEASPGEAPRSLDPLTRMLEELETSRRWVEDATAAKLFSEAAGFVPGRIDPETLERSLDLTWIARLLCWDEARLAAWTRTTRSGWIRGWREGYALPRLLVELTLDPARRPSPERLIASLAALFGERGSVEAVLDGQSLDWREPRVYPAVDLLDDFLAADLPREEQRPSEAAVLAPALRSDFLTTPEDWDELPEDSPFVVAAWRAFDAVWNRAPDETQGGERLRTLFASRRWDAQERLLQITTELARDWDAHHQQAISERLARLLEVAGPEQRTPEGRLVFSDASRERARERAEFFLKDYGQRPRRLLAGEPDYEVIYLLTRYYRDYPGFDAREVREREYPVLPGDAVRAAPGLIGNVTAVGIDDMLVQREASARMRELMDRPEKSDAEREELSRLVGRVLLHDEVKGVAGVEGYWNRELTGRNGYRETHGLEDIFGTGRREEKPIEVVNGQSLTLTLDTDLQRAARRTLETPVVVADSDYDHHWAAHPVGAIVLVTAEGDVLAAASEPNAGSERGVNAQGQRGLLLERTLRRPTFQPPGSVFKPFVAAYALDRVQLDPAHPVTCADLGGRRGAGYVDVRCHSRFGHGVVGLRSALVGSCNAYFAWLGETLEESHLREVVSLFGFDRPTGIRTPPPWDDGFGLHGHFREDVGGMRPGALSDHDRRLAGNGLGVVEATPLALARAVAGLATGELPDLRLVRAIGDTELPPARRTAVPLSEGAMEFVREALWGVTSDPGSASTPAGTGRALARSHLGFDVSAKTGSADLVSGTDSEGRSVVRKHAWVAGWLPPEEPRLVFVVFVHDTMATSSHGAVYLTRDLLLRPAVLNWLAENGVDVSGVPAR